MAASVAVDFKDLLKVSLDTAPLYGRWVLDQVRKRPSSFPVTLSVSLPELEVGVHLEEGEMAGAIRDNFAVAPASMQRARIDIFLAHPGLPGIPTPAAWTGPYLPHQVATAFDSVRLRGSHFHDLDFWQFLDIEAGVGVQQMRAADAYPPWEPAAPLRAFLHWLYAEQGLRLAHCGVLGIGGRGVLLAGAGGAGKSGTVTAGLMHGLQSVGDDYVLLSADEVVIARPIFATLKLDPASWTRLGLQERLGTIRPLNWQGKHELRIQDIITKPIPTEQAIAALLMPRITGEAKSRISPLARRDAMLALAASSISQMPGDRGSGFAFFSRIANLLPCYSLELGTDPAEIAGTIGGFLQRDGG